MGARSKPVELVMRSFEKQGDATAIFKAMLNRYRPGERVSDEDGLDVAAFSSATLNMSPRWAVASAISSHDDRAWDAMIPDHPHGWQRHGVLISTLHLPETAQP